MKHTANRLSVRFPGYQGERAIQNKEEHQESDPGKKRKALEWPVEESDDREAK